MSLSVCAQEEEQRLQVLNDIYQEKTAILVKGESGSSQESKHIRSKNVNANNEIALSADISRQAEAFIEVNPNNPNNVVASFMSGANILSFPIYSSNDGGLSWSKSNFDARSQTLADLPGHEIGGGGDPVFTFDSFGNCYFSWVYLTIKTPATGQLDTGYFNLLWAKSIDGGQNWTVASNNRIGFGAIIISGGNVITGIAQVGEGIFDRQWMASDRSGGVNNGNVYVSAYYIPHASSTNSSEGLVLFRMTPSDTAFQRISLGGAGTTQFGNVVVDQNNGDIHVSYADLGSNQVMHSVSKDGGDNFSIASQVASSSSLFPRSPTKQIHRRENGATNMALDGAGNIHIVWTDYPVGDYKAYCSSSYDGGNTWSTPLLLDGLLSGGEKAFMPTIAAYNNGVNISFYAINSLKKSTYKAVNSLDNGKNFGAPETLSRDTTNFQNAGLTFYGDYNRSVRNDCDLYSAWSDGRSNTPAVYISKSDACAGNIGFKEISPLIESMAISSAYPQPANQTFNLEVISTKNDKLEIDIYDLGGVLVHHISKQVSKGSNTFSFEVGQLTSGAYLVNMVNNEGFRFSRKLIIEQTD